MSVYNGGVSGYSSGQELIKLIRDILSLRPDMIIVYDGFNELGIDVQHPFAFAYARKIVDFAAKHMEMDRSGGDERAVALGVWSERDFFSNWLFNIRNMYALSVSNNIKFYCFCQPELSTKKGKTIHERNMLLSAPCDYALKRKKEGFRSYIKKVCELPDYIHDLSHIFDGEADIYMDSCHVWEKGNRIIAKEIMNVILPEMKKREDRNK